MPGRASVTTSPLTFRLSQRVLVEGMPFLGFSVILFSDYGIRYSCIGAILMSKQVADVVGRWKHGHSFMVCKQITLGDSGAPDGVQAHPMSCAGAVAVQKVIAAENLVENGRLMGEYLGRLLRERLLSANSVSKAITFDIRGGGSFWAVEFEFSEGNLERKEFAMRVQARCLENGLIVIGMPPGVNRTDREGGHIIFAPGYNITSKEVEEVVSLFMLSVVDATCGD